MSYETAEKNRQKILDHMNAQPIDYKPSGPEIMEATGLSKGQWEACSKTMCAQYEIERSGKGRMTRFTVLKKTTVTAHDLKWQVGEASMEAVLNNRKANAKPGVYVHTPDMPITNQGGQGAVRSRVYVGSSAGVV